MSKINETRVRRVMESAKLKGYDIVTLTEKAADAANIHLFQAELDGDDVEIALWKSRVMRMPDVRRIAAEVALT